MMRKRIGSAGLGIRFLMKRTCWEVYHCMTGSIHPEKGGEGDVKVNDCSEYLYLVKKTDEAEESVIGKWVRVFSGVCPEIGVELQDIPLELPIIVLGL